jgi:retron-type reverse transcriptase
VCAIFKKGDKTKCANYRPISLLSNISKIFERIMYNRIEDFLDEYDIIYEYQFGFRKKHSTNHALLSIVESIRKDLDNKTFSCGVFVDLEKAFDTVNHNILLAKLEHYGIRDNALSCFFVFFIYSCSSAIAKNKYMETINFTQD